MCNYSRNTVSSSVYYSSVGLLSSRLAGVYYCLTDIRNMIGIAVSALHFAADPIVCLTFLPGIRRALLTFCCEAGRRQKRR